MVVPEISLSAKFVPSPTMGVIAWTHARKWGLLVAVAQFPGAFSQKVGDGSVWPLDGTAKSHLFVTLVF